MGTITLKNNHKRTSRIAITLKNLKEGIAWLETPAITLIAFATAWLVNSQDPLTLTSDFPWIILAPLLVGLRYGFAWAAVSTGLLLISGWLNAQWLEIQWRTPAAWFLGTLAVSTIAGEFRDQWQQRLTRSQQASRYRKARMNEFTRSYQLLKRSHALLEQEVALSGYSLYGAVADISNQLISHSSEQPALDSCATDLIRLLGHYGEIQAGTLLHVKNGKVNTKQPLAAIGEIPELKANDLLIKRALLKREASCIKPEPFSQNKALNKTQLLACVPLIDSHDNYHALLAIRLMPFTCLNENHISQLAVLCGHMADLLYMTELTREIPHHEPKIRAFHANLERCWKDAVEYNLQAGLVAIEIGNFGVAQALIDSITIHKRALDQVLTLKARDSEHWIALILMPLSEQDDTHAYLQKFPDFLKKHHKVDMAKAEVNLSHFIVNSDSQNPVEMARFLNDSGYPLSATFTEEIPPSNPLQTKGKDSVSLVDGNIRTGT